MVLMTNPRMKSKKYPANILIEASVKCKDVVSSNTNLMKSVKIILKEEGVEITKVKEDIPNPVDTGEIKLVFIFMEYRKLERIRQLTTYVKRLLLMPLIMLKKTKNAKFVKQLGKQTNVKNVIKSSASIVKSKCTEKVYLKCSRVTTLLIILAIQPTFCIITKYLIMIQEQIWM